MAWGRRFGCFVWTKIRIKVPFPSRWTKSQLWGSSSDNLLPIILRYVDRNMQHFFLAITNEEDISQALKKQFEARKLLNPNSFGRVSSSFTERSSWLSRSSWFSWSFSVMTAVWVIISTCSWIPSTDKHSTVVFFSKSRKSQKTS